MKFVFISIIATLSSVPVFSRENSLRPSIEYVQNYSEVVRTNYSGKNMKEKTIEAWKTSIEKNARFRYVKSVKTTDDALGYSWFMEETKKGNLCIADAITFLSRQAAVDPSIKLKVVFYEEKGLG